MVFHIFIHKTLRTYPQSAAILMAKTTENLKYFLLDSPFFGCKIRP
jgi:hypothetical protein